MDVFELQLNTALEGTISGSTRASTPAESMMASLQRNGRRPDTRNTAATQLTRLTTASQTLSVMGVARQTAARPGTGVGSMMSGDGDGRMFERSEYISSRIAAIQAKVSEA